MNCSVWKDRNSTSIYYASTSCNHGDHDDDSLKMQLKHSQKI